LAEYLNYREGSGTLQQFTVQYH